MKTARNPKKRKDAEVTLEENKRTTAKRAPKKQRTRDVSPLSDYDKFEDMDTAPTVAEYYRQRGLDIDQKKICKFANVLKVAVAQKNGVVLCAHVPEFLPKSEADKVFWAIDGARTTPRHASLAYPPRGPAGCDNDTLWRQLDVVMFGKKVPQPRGCAATAVAPDPKKDYRYAGLTVPPNAESALRDSKDAKDGIPAAQAMKMCRLRASELAGVPLDYALMNRYGPKDRIGAHSDNEKDMVQTIDGRPIPIVSISLGATRIFRIALRKPPKSESKEHEQERTSRRICDLEMKHNTALLMFPPMQQHMTHEVPPMSKKALANTAKTKPIFEDRINLTYRALVGNFSSPQK